MIGWITAQEEKNKSGGLSFIIIIIIFCLRIKENAKKHALNVHGDQDM